MKLKKLLENHLQKVTGYSQVEKHDDHEVEMAINDLHSIVHRASELVKRIEEQGVQELEGWVQAKITKSADYINAVYDNYMFASEDSYHDECGDCGHEEEDDDDEEDLDEAKPNPQSTCCGRCGRFHVKGTTCRKPYLTGDRHCRNRPRK
jgi:hypothetical protein